MADRFALWVSLLEILATQSFCGIPTNCLHFNNPYVSLPTPPTLKAILRTSRQSTESKARVATTFLTPRCIARPCLFAPRSPTPPRSY